MKNEEIIKKISNNKLFLYLVPNFIYISLLFYYYNINFKNIINVLFSEVMVISILLFGVSNILYLLLLKILKSRQKVFIMMVFISVFYCINLNLKTFLMLLLFLCLLVFEFKTIIKFKLDKFIFVMVIIICMVFLYNTIGTTINLAKLMIKSKDYNQEIVVNVEKNKKSPNIYYIHCDGMLSFEAMEKYFKYDNKYLKDYLKGYYVNEDATILSGNRTQRSLVALFNPKYNDAFFQEYLEQLEDVSLDRKKETDYYVDYYELEDKRFNNEFFEAFDKKGYTTVGIGEYNAYTSFDVDYFYDYFNNYKDDRYLDVIDSQLRLIRNNIDSFSRKRYIRFSHMKLLMGQFILSDLLVDYIPIDYEKIEYNDMDITDYFYINKVYEDSNYWPAKAIIKGLNDSMKINDNSRITFVDFNLNHSPYVFNENGNIVFDKMYIGNYLGNYIYSSYILTDILDYIKKNDTEAIIILQGDHGLHLASNQVLMDFFDTDIQGVQDVRNAVISAIYIPKKYQNGDEKYLDNPLNISRYLVNNFVGNNYEYIQ